VPNLFFIESIFTPGTLHFAYHARAAYQNKPAAKRSKRMKREAGRLPFFVLFSNPPMFFFFEME